MTGSHEARGSSPLSSTNSEIDRVLQNKHQAVSQGRISQSEA